jgi:CubicO group peptidase (beta-lactamase class C family)
MKVFLRHLVCLTPILASTGVAQGLPKARPEDVGLSSAALGRIAPAMQAMVDSNRVAGIAMAIARHGKLAYFGAVGTMDSARTAPMKPDAVFRMYSMSKTVTSVAIMQLVEAGKISLEDPVAKFIPAFADTKVYASGGSASPVLRAPDRPMTIAHLLLHTSGLTYGIFGNSAVDSIYRRSGLFADQPIEQLANTLASLPLRTSPGDAWEYSLSIDVLGRVVEVASGLPFDRYLEERIFAPLKMRETGFVSTPAMDGHITWLFTGQPGRIRAAGQLLSAGYRPGAKSFLGGSGLLSTIPDYLRFSQMLLNGGELEGARLLKKETVALMMQNHLPQKLVPIGLLRGYGFGYGGAVQVDSSGALPTPAGTYRWSGLATTFYWIDTKNDLIGMVWAQLNPTWGGLVQPFERLVYAAIEKK